MVYELRPVKECPAADENKENAEKPSKFKKIIISTPKKLKATICKIFSAKNSDKKHSEVCDLDDFKSDKDPKRLVLMPCNRTKVEKLQVSKSMVSYKKSEKPLTQPESPMFLTTSRALLTPRTKRSISSNFNFKKALKKLSFFLGQKFFLIGY